MNKFVLNASLIILALSSCTFSGRTKEKNNSVTKFITGNAAIDTVKDVHIINMIRAIGAPNNSISVDKYRYYNWQNSRTVGVSTLFGGGSTTLYCNLTAETQANKIKLINWYGNQCGIFLDPMGEYFKDKLNIAVITDEDEKKAAAAKEASDDSKSKNIEPSNKPAIDLRQKTSEQQKTPEQNKAVEPQNMDQVAPSLIDSKPKAVEKINIPEVK